MRLLLVRIPRALPPSKCPEMALVVRASKAAHLKHSLHGMSATPCPGGARCLANAEDQLRGLQHCVMCIPMASPLHPWRARHACRTILDISLRTGEAATQQGCAAGPE